MRANKIIIYKNIIGALTAILIFSQIFTLVLTARASTDNMLWGGYESNVQISTGLGNTDPRQMAASIVNIALGFLGVIMVLIIIVGVVIGAGPDGGEKSKTMIIAGVIGLAVILAAFGLAQFAISAFYGATGASG